MWHSINIKEVFKKLNSSENGLSEDEVKKRLKEFGENTIELKERISAFKIFISQFTDFLIIILIIAAIISYLIGFLPGREPNVVDSLLILCIVIANGIFGFIQDYKAEKSILELKKLSTPYAKVVRNGKIKVINSRYIVPGDIIILNQGDIVPADARLIEVENLKVDESMLTGESVSVDKCVCDLPKDVNLAERKNMVFMNTIVTKGGAKAIVVKTGLDTEFGKIAHSMQKAEKKEAPFTKEINKLGKKIGIFILILIAFVAGVQILQGKLDLIVVFLTSIALAVAAIPEGLPAIITLSLAIGTKKMLKRKSLVRRLSVIESLGSVDVICTDKTGTLTENKMTVKKIFFDNLEVDVSGVGYETKGKFTSNGKEINIQKIKPLLEAGLICNDTIITKENGKEKFIGDPTEIALVVCAKKANILTKCKRDGVVEFSSERKMMSVACVKDGKRVLYSKGAPEVIIEKCKYKWEGRLIKKLTKKDKEIILNKVSEFASQGLRVLAFAYKLLRKSDKVNEDVEKDLIFLGLQAMIDPPRKEVKGAIELCEKAGIKVKMVTGDNVITAKAIAKEIGIGTKAIQGKDLDKLSEEKLKKIVEEYDIFARVSPEHKVRILKALQSNEHIVAITGDGVNDAPALKRADVGISMGIRGTDVARQASDMVLLDDNFATIVEAIKQGRTIFDNIRNFVNYLLTSNFAEVFVVFIASLFGYLPITAVQILWINLLTDGFPALALGVDPPRKDVMQRKPKRKDDGIIDKRLTYLIGAIGLKKTMILLITFLICLISKGLVFARSVVFTGFVLYEFVRIGVIRYQDKLSWFSNKWLLIALATSIGLQLLVIYSPLNKVFGVVPIDLFGWAVLLSGVAIGAILAIVITKVIIKITE
ncbi:MAG: cation-transporting P-type ATPase [Nanoarchaeota archaeon]|nr:cation-transporting P-type ATPase [Nanoarchaeota archaeon]